MDQLQPPFISPRFAGIATFFRLPHVADPSRLDVAICGVPFDGGVTNRPGARLGPRQVREMSASFIRRVHPGSNEAPADRCRVGDLGDSPVNPIDQQDSLRLIADYFAAIHRAGAVPLAIGGDHLVSLPILRGIARERPVGMVHFDAHTDTYDAVWSAASKYDNGTVFRRAVEEGLLDPKRTIQIGIRGSRFGFNDLEYSQKSGMRVVTIDEFFELGTERVVAEARRVAGDGPTYVSFDVDGLDAVFVPGTGAPEVGGYTTRDAQVMIRGLKGLNLVGADMVEVCPLMDESGATARVGANIAFELLEVLTDSVARRNRR